jgi:hypothetical protein
MRELVLVEVPVPHLRNRVEWRVQAFKLNTQWLIRSSNSSLLPNNRLSNLLIDTRAYFLL